VVREEEGNATAGLLVIDGDFKHLHGREFEGATAIEAVQAAKDFVAAEAEKLGQQAKEAGDA